MTTAPQLPSKMVERAAASVMETLLVGGHNIGLARAFAASHAALSAAGVDKLLEALRDARDLVADWGAYAGDYFQEKHDLAGDIARIDAVLAAVDSNENGGGE